MLLRTSLRSIPCIAIHGGNDLICPPQTAYALHEAWPEMRLRVVPDQEGDSGGSELHIDRHAGDVLQFHSFYRDVRNQLAGANGWVNNQGRYEHDVYGVTSSPRAT